MTELSRRGFLHGALIGGGALTLAVSCGGGGSSGAARIRNADQTGELLANMYVTVKPDGRISLIVNKAEMGQGVTTAYTTLVAEELGVPIDRVDVHYADSNPEMRTSFNMQITGGSTSTNEAYLPLRRAAASAREMLVAAAAAGWRVPARDCRVEDGFVLHGANKASYGELTKQAARQPVPAKPRLKPPSEFTLIGKTNRRVDARAKVDGTAQFGIDVKVPDMVHAFVIHAPVYGAQPDKVTADAARTRPGVIDVFPFRWGVAVVAEKYWQALAAARDVQVTWGKGDTAGLDTAAMQQAMRAYDDSGTSIVDDGNAGKGLSHAQTKIGGVYEAPYLAHAPMEPQNCTVRVTGTHAEVWAPTQSPTLVQVFVADAIGISPDDVLVHVTLSGGGFGRRAVPDVAAQAAMIAKHVKRPVKLVWSRESDMTQAFYRPIYSVKFEGGVADGKVTGARMHCISQSIALSARNTVGAAIPGIPGAIKSMFVDSLLAMFSTNTLGDLFATEGLKDSPYQFKDIEITASPVQTKLPVSTWRSVGNSVTGFVMESFVDELAHAAKRDPLELRRQLLAPDSRQTRVLDALATLSKWSTPPPRGIGRGLARHFAFETEVAEVAEVEIVDDRIKVRRVYCVVDCGIAVNPDVIRSQLEGAVIFGLSAALDQEITLVDGVVQQRNFDTFPLLRMFEAPEIIVQILDSDRDPTGVGEPGLPPLAPAVANAIFALTGVRLRRMPLQRAWNERGAR
jgi:isoquinoline 1-oxidoreductase/isoquinoline 1-oxidoreductase beta subunit